MAAVEALIAREVERGLAPERIVLAGFSQGGAIALHAALIHPERLAGAVALSTYLVLTEALDAARHPANHGLPIFQAHGSSDPMVVFERGEAAHEQLVAWGHPVDWHVYGMMHQVCLEEIQALGSWLAARLA